MIHARGLARTFRTKRDGVDIDVAAVNGVDLDISAGEIIGFLGPNGAGKTTTLRMLTTLLKPTKGTATVAGHNVLTDPIGVRKHIGFVSQYGSASPLARAGEEIVDYGMLYNLRKSQATSRAKELFSQLELHGLWERQPQTMSGGQRRRLDIAMGLVHDPDLVFLDEPTAGLDPHSRANLWEHIRQLREQLGMTVFLTTHYLEEADALADRIIIIDRGQIVANGTADDLKSEVAGDFVEVGAKDPSRSEDIAQHFLLLGASSISVEGPRVSARLHDSAQHLPHFLNELGTVGVELSDLTVTRPSLDDVFLNLTGRALRESHQ